MGDEAGAAAPDAGRPAEVTDSFKDGEALVESLDTENAIGR